MCKNQSPTYIKINVAWSPGPGEARIGGGEDPEARSVSGGEERGAGAAEPAAEDE